MQEPKEEICMRENWFSKIQNSLHSFMRLLQTNLSKECYWPLAKRLRISNVAVKYLQYDDKKPLSEH